MQEIAVSEGAFSGVVGVARRDITPPIGIYARNWGAAPADVAEAVHRPLTATVLAIRSRAGGAPLVLAAVDLGWFRSPIDEWAVRSTVLDRLGLEQSRLMIALSHTHAGPSLCAADQVKPGGQLIPAYLESLSQAIIAAAEEAIANGQEAVLSWTSGRCGLARNRDFDAGGRHVCGFNPRADADDNLVVGRVTRADGQVLATIVNYACHPTTLAWENRHISPDYVGAMRELVEDATGAPCLFLQGASGELGPRDGYTGDVSVADANGRILGHAALSALESLLPAGSRLEFDGIVESGAPLGVWRTCPARPSEKLESALVQVRYQAKAAEQLDAVERMWDELEERVREERMSRRAQMRASLADAEAGIGLWLWRVGDVVLVAQPNEAYSRFQTELRKRFPDTTLVVMNLVNGGGLGYLPDSNAYEFEQDLYQVWQTPFARGSLDRLIDTAERSIREELPA